MKKLFVIMIAMLMMGVAYAEGTTAPAEAFDWTYLATMAGATAAT